MNVDVDSFDSGLFRPYIGVARDMSSSMDVGNGGTRGAYAFLIFWAKQLKIKPDFETFLDFIVSGTP